MKKIFILLSSIAFFTCVACDMNSLMTVVPDTTTPIQIGDDQISVGQPHWNDPGTGSFTKVSPEECGLDSSLLAQADRAINTPYIIVRYGEICHEYRAANDRATDVFSATKTLGGLVTGLAHYETRNIPKSGPGTGQLMDTDMASDWINNLGQINRNARLAHVLSMSAHTAGMNRYTYDTVGMTQINKLSNAITKAISQDAGRLGRSVSAFTQNFLFKPLGMNNSAWGGTVFATGWTTTLQDMARMGLVILHQGMYDGKRILDDYWTYRMTHPANEAANTNYGYLTWLNSRGGGTGIGGLGAGVQEDACSPAAIWPDYPHPPSTATSCGATRGRNCDMEYDVGVWSAQGMGGQFIIGHPGLDLLICAKNFSGGDGPTGLFKAIRPALVAMDPQFKGDESAFCAAYGANSYAPDVQVNPTP